VRLPSYNWPGTTAVKSDDSPIENGPFAVASGKFRVGGLVAAGGSVQDAAIFYPRAEPGGRAPAYNVVSFGHGYSSGGLQFLPAYTPLLSTLASYGLVVLAPLSCPTQFCLTAGADDFFHDILSVITTCAANRSLHEGLLHANFSSIGVGGHR
jgi:hypothetical protein